MKVRNRKSELEARLNGTSGSLFSRPSGKVERTVYSDGTEQLKISIRGLKRLEGKTAIISSGLYELARIIIEDGRGRYELESGITGKIPELKLDDSVDVKINDEIVMTGILYQD